MPVISNINNIKSGITKTDISSIHPIHDMVSNQSRIHNFLWYYIDSINQNEFQFQNHEKINGKEHANYSSYPYQNSIRESQQQNNITNSNVLNDTGLKLLNKSPRFVECQFSVGGLANKMFGLVSSYVIAALLNAALICMCIYIGMLMSSSNEVISIDF